MFIPEKHTLYCTPARLSFSKLIHSRCGEDTLGSLSTQMLSSNMKIHHRDTDSIEHKDTTSIDIRF